ncbi:MAG: hypothetical protein LRY38_08240 [Aeromonadaceae bacterium]|nr:hypothetical protein [Aeromonadaceae bacterium]
MNNPIAQTTFEATFTDAYGVEHPAAVCAIAAISRTESCHFTSDLATAGETTANCYYSVRYWHNAEALASGAKDLLYSDKEGIGQLQFAFTGDKTLTELLSDCQAHFIAILAGTAQ